MSMWVFFAAYLANIVLNVSSTNTCTPPDKCGGRDNEHWVNCPLDCLPKNCSQLGLPVPCPIYGPSKKCPVAPGCICNDGFLRNSNGICVPKKQCPKCGDDENAESGCGNCQTTCRNYNNTKPQICTESCNLNGCNCKKGFILDENTNKCVCPEDCTPICGPDEYFDSCSNGGCHNGRVCDDLEWSGNGTTICVDPIRCKPGCLCRKGLLRNRDGKCVPKDKCPKYRCGGRDNEHWVDCPVDCLPKNCSQLGLPVPCPIYGPSKKCPVAPGCICNDGYLRNDKGNCVLKKQCPKCGDDENAESGCGNCQTTCRNYNNTKPQICTKSCNLNGCNCKKGFILDENTNKCVCPKDCTPICGPDEYFDYCSNGGCHNGRLCRDVERLNGSTICIDPIRCIPGCLCRKGLLRNPDGKCVPKDKCPKSCGGDENAELGCGSNCGRRCSDYDQGPIACAAICEINGCECKNGYVYDDNINKCVPPNKCTPLCGPFEQFTLCANSGCFGIQNCSQITCESDSTDLCIDPAKCIPGCICKDGFLWNDNGVCVDQNQCSQNVKCSGKPNEYWEYCLPMCLSEACADIGKPVKICPPQAAVCRSGCRCAPGFYRDYKGVCVARNQCPKNPCKNNEVYDMCPDKCPPRVCGIDDRLIDCAPQPLPGDPNCPPPACRCADGFYRNYKGECVKWEKCPKCPLHEVFDLCPNPCPGQLCSVDERVIRCAAPPKVGDPNCKPGCRCEDGYKRNETGICIPKDQCPPICRGENERYDPCPSPCDPNTCASIGNKFSCTLKPDGKSCKGACRCKPGFYRDRRGNCISKENCSPLCGPFEQFTLCANSGCFGIQNCSQITCESDSTDLCSIDPAKCIPGCICKDGFLWNDNGVCVDQNQCSQNVKCSGKPNEYWEYCLPMCLSEACADIGKPVKICPPQAAVCRSGCRCAPGFYRDYKGVCVARNQCPKNPCKNNEVYDMCPDKCPPRVCGIDDRLIDCAPQPLPGDPNCPPPACRCADGFYRNYKGECVKWEKCPKCPLHEVFDLCPNPCPGQLCSVDERVIRCAAPPKVGDPNCKPGCRCEDGYKRNETGICIPKDQCPPICRGENERYDPCPSPCDPNTCASIGNKFSCPLKPDGKSCKGACRCKPGFYRDRRGNCISKENCLKCNKPNEYYACGGACDNVCATLSQQNQTSCPIINVKCNEMCYCDKGFARNRQGLCVPISTCRCCKGQREWSDTSCQPTCPPNDSCDTYKKVYSCPLQISGDTSDCKPVCRCENNFLRDKNGICIPEEQCPCNGDPNAKPGCGCSQTCSDYCANRPPRCTKICKINACDCKAGYVLEEKSGRCILPVNCPGYQNQVTTPKPTNGTTIQEAVQALSRGVNVFAFNFLKQLFKILAGQNFIVSPFSCQVALAELALNGQDNTLKQLLAVLSLSSNDQIRQGFKTFLDSTKSGDGVTFTKVDNIYVNDKYLLSESFRNDTLVIFNGTAENMNCNDPIGTTNNINKRVASETDGLIQNLLSSDLINSLTILVMVNAIYFEANWKEEFNKNNTKLSDFYTSDNKIVQVQMMDIETKLEYFHSDVLNAQVLRIPYKNSNYSCVIILPTNKTGLPETVANLNAVTMKTALDNLYLTKVKLSLPSMELNTSLDLVEILKAMGVTDIFDPYKANFDGILEVYEKLYVTAFIQKAYVKIHEQGSKAAAATGVVVTTFSLPISLPPVVLVRADHPFLFTILGNDNILFLGVFNGKV